MNQNELDTLWQDVLSAHGACKPFFNRNIPTGSEEEKEFNRKKVKLHDALIKYAEALKIGNATDQQ